MTTPLTRSDSFMAHAQRLLNSGCGVIIVRTTEPFRARNSIRTLSSALSQPCWHWDMIRGWYDSNESTKKTIANTQGGPTPFVAMGSNDMPPHAVGVMLWPHPILKQVPQAVHQLAILCDSLPVKTIKQGSDEIPDRRCLFMLTPPEFDIPNEVRDMIPILDFSVPDREELRSVLSDSLASAESNGKIPSFNKEDTDTILSVAAGLTELEAETAFSLALVTHATQLPNIKVDDFCAVVSEAKVDAVKRSDVLEIMPAGSPDDIGGLENLKQWVAETAICLSEEAREAGIDQPKGVFLAGPPGTGKSASAKAIAGVLRLPLIKFDVSRVFSSLVGSSEQRVKSCLKLIESMAPCVALVDEVDKVFNVNSGGGDSGVGARVLGTMLTFMQESKAGVFWVVTANRVSGLPPELLRKGRLDETFAVTVPNEEERLAVLGIHLRKRKHDPATIEGLEHAAAASNGFVPAELEAAVNEALKHGFVHKVPVTGDLILEQLSQMKPLSEAFAEQFKEMEQWADNNARPASSARAAAARPTRTVPQRDGAAPAPTRNRRAIRTQG
ncbi:hypothetical protein H10PHJ05_65 [Aeromonas phage HJ05]|nr:hypothetical protein H10PHJ05_65 [Aeromonas phage HJ05]